jgi:hypothetical protein
MPWKRPFLDNVSRRAASFRKSDATFWSVLIASNLSPTLSANIDVHVAYETCILSLPPVPVADREALLNCAHLWPLADCSGHVRLGA